MSHQDKEKGSAPQRRGQAVVSAVMKATRAELIESGYGGLKFEAVAQRAGVNKTTIYRRWKNRFTLVRSALLDTSEHLELEPLVGQVEEDLRRYMYTLAELAQSPLGKVVLVELLSSENHAEMVKLIDDFRELREGHPRHILLEGQRTGQLRAGFDVDVALWMLRGAFMRLLMCPEQGVDAFTPEYIDQVLALLLSGMRPLRD